MLSSRLIRSLPPAGIPPFLRCRAYSFFSSVESDPTTYKVQRILEGVCPDSFFAIVADVDSYKDFLPYCRKSEVTKIIGLVDDVLDSSPPSRSPSTQTNNSPSRKFVFEADLDIGVEGTPFAEVYKSRVVLDRAERSVKIEAIESTMFDSLRSTWVIENASTVGKPPIAGEAPSGAEISSLISFSVDFRCSGLGVQSFVRGVFPAIANGQMEAFSRRVRERSK